MKYEEKHCKIKLLDTTYTQRGAHIIHHPETHRLLGILYAYPHESKVGNWHGNLKWDAKFGYEWRSNFGDTRQSVYFSIGQTRCYGVYYKSGSDIIRFRQISKDI